MHDKALLAFLEHTAYQLRLNSLIMTTHAGSGHPTSCLSAADIVTALFFYAMRYDPQNPDSPNNDRFILSKGHAVPVLYAAWKELGILSQEELMTYRTFNSILEGHPTLRFSRNEAATGSLGIGLSIGSGMALTARLDNRDYRTYVLLGDGEVAEGSVWEATELADHYKLTNLIALLDCNRLGQSDQTLYNHHTNRYAAMFSAFGWHVITIDGHSLPEILAALDDAHQQRAPTIIIAKTFKGYGIDALENHQGHHGKPLKPDELPAALQALETRFPEAATYDGAYQWKPQAPLATAPHHRLDASTITCAKSGYALGTMMATRESYGHALAALGNVCQDVVSLDGDVKNSTYAEIFEKVHPKRFFQCYIAEQNMVGMAIGMDRRGKIPFVSTFGAFFSRAYDQIRMAAIGNARLRLVGSHAGVSIGQDGPSQMALEDISLMRALPDSVVLYPCDAVSTQVLVEAMARYDKGISYLRTTRMATPVLYDAAETFPLGGCKILKHSDHDHACIVAAGITVFEALKAYDQLKKEGISVAVIDLYSIKPLDQETVLAVASKSKKRVITVEDHYIQGGLGEAVTYALRSHDLTITCLAVPALPRSGTPQELLAWAGIDAAAISKAVKR